MNAMYISKTRAYQTNHV